MHNSCKSKPAATEAKLTKNLPSHPLPRPLPHPFESNLRCPSSALRHSLKSDLFLQPRSQGPPRRHPNSPARWETQVNGGCPTPLSGTTACKPCGKRQKGWLRIGESKVERHTFKPSDTRVARGVPGALTDTRAGGLHTMRCVQAQACDVI